MFRLLGAFFELVVKTLFAFTALFFLWILIEAGPKVVTKAAETAQAHVDNLEKRQWMVTQVHTSAAARHAAKTVQLSAHQVLSDEAARRARGEMSPIYTHIDKHPGTIASSLAEARLERTKLQAKQQYYRQLRATIESECTDDKEEARGVSNPVDWVIAQARRIPKPNEMPETAARLLSCQTLHVMLPDADDEEEIANDLAEVEQRENTLMTALSLKTSADAAWNALEGELARLAETRREAEQSLELLDQRTVYAQEARDMLEDGWWNWLKGQFKDKWAWIVLILLAAVALPYLWRCGTYYILMPLLGTVRELRLADDIEPTTGSARFDKAERVCRVEVEPGERLVVRSDHVRPVEPGVARTRILYDWSAWIISLVTKLVAMTEISASVDRESPVHVSIADSAHDGADNYILRVDLDDHPGLVLHPDHLVGVLGDIELKTKWKLFSAHAWATGQLRYIYFKGTGSLFLSGIGDVAAERLEGSARQETHGTLIGFDTRLGVKVRRTETFLPYLFKIRPLVEVGMEGDGVYLWQKSERSGSQSPLQRGASAIWGAIGKLFGF